MKVKIPLVLLLVLAAAVGYMLGTENGRTQRDVILVKMGRKDAEGVGEAVGDAPTDSGTAAD